MTRLERISNAIDPTATFCFLPISGMSRCNDYVACFMAALGAPFSPPGSSANNQHAWLSVPANGWRRATLAEAADAANLDRPAIAAWLNPPGHGHIAVVMGGSTVNGLIVSAAGRQNFHRAPLEKSFGLAKPDLFILKEP